MDELADGTFRSRDGKWSVVLPNLSEVSRLTRCEPTTAKAPRQTGRDKVLNPSGGDLGANCLAWCCPISISRFRCYGRPAIAPTPGATHLREAI